MTDKVIPLRPDLTIEFDNLICECGCERFYISVYLKAVCIDCRAWMDGCVDLEGEHK